MADCGGTTDQFWRWESMRFTTPNIEWNFIGCNNNGPIETTIKTGVTFGEKISQTTSLSVEASISAKTDFGGVEVKTSVSNSLANEWSKSST